MRISRHKKTATEIRSKEHEAFVALKKDLEQAIGQLKLAIQTLSDVDADQTAGDSAADHKHFMAGQFLQRKISKVHEAVAPVLNWLEPVLKQKMEAFLQAPFTGTYTSQSGEVIGILKNMEDKFTKTVATATVTEAEALKAYEALMKVKSEEHAKMTSSLAKKQDQIGDNESELTSRRASLKSAEDDKQIKEDFLSELLPLCEKRTNEYDVRASLRADEEAALAEAIAILDSDTSFGVFAGADATSTGGTAAALFQIRRHNVASQDKMWPGIRWVLQDVAKSGNSMRLLQLKEFVQAHNAFAQVLEEIEKMMKTIEAEGVADKQKLDWCTTERADNDALHAKKVAAIADLNKAITSLTNEIEEPDTGLKDRIAAGEISLNENVQNQNEATSTRKNEHEAFQSDVNNLQIAQNLLTKAIRTLSSYYSKLEAEKGIVHGGGEVLSGETDAVAETGEKLSDGQSARGAGVLKMLSYILDETGKEEKEARATEKQSDADFRDLMSKLKIAQKDLETSIVEMQATLAQKEKELFASKKDLKETTSDKKAIDAYLLSIKAGCDFIVAQFDHRETSRAAETKALENAIAVIKDTPVYKTFVADQHQEQLGNCAQICNETGEAHVKCKACLAKTSIPGYCAGHAGTEGCSE